MFILWSINRQRIKFKFLKSSQSPTGHGNPLEITLPNSWNTKKKWILLSHFPFTISNLTPEILAKNTFCNFLPKSSSLLDQLHQCYSYFRDFTQEIVPWKFYSEFLHSDQTRETQSYPIGLILFINSFKLNNQLQKERITGGWLNQDLEWRVWAALILGKVISGMKIYKN